MINSIISLLVFGLKHSKNLFYRKEDGKSFFFEKTTEDIHFEPLAFNEDFLTCIVFNEDFPNYEKVLPSEEYKKLEERLEDDNPCLIKFILNEKSYTGVRLFFLSNLMSADREGKT